MGVPLSCFPSCGLPAADEAKAVSVNRLSAPLFVQLCPLQILPLLLRGWLDETKFSATWAKVANVHARTT